MDAMTIATRTITAFTIFAGSAARAADTAASGATGPAAGTLLGLTLLLALCAGLPFWQRAGRRFARRRLQRALRRQAVDVLDDFIVPGAYDGLTHIHYAVLTRSGILCVHTRHCRGTVTGHASDAQWFATHGSSSRQFLNPAIQNAGHVKALARIVPEVPVSGLVVFTGPATLRDVTDDNVIRMAALADYLAAANETDDPPAGLQEAWQTLQASALTDAATRKDLDAQLSFG